MIDSMSVIVTMRVLSVKMLKNFANDISVYRPLIV